MSNDEYSGNVQMRVEFACSVLQLRQQYLQSVILNLSEEQLNSGMIRTLETTLSIYRGGYVHLVVKYNRIRGEQGVIRLGKAWSVLPEQDLFERLTQEFGANVIEYQYDVAAVRSRPLPEKRQFRTAQAMVE